MMFCTACGGVVWWSGQVLLVERKEKKLPCVPAVVAVAGWILTVLMHARRRPALRSPGSSLWETEVTILERLVFRESSESSNEG
jgi:hypothetical protein